MQPRRIDVRKEAGEMVLEWEDGKCGKIPLEVLRRACPCAECNEHREQQHAEAGLHMLTEDELAASDELAGIVPMGRYAVKIRWADGHETGIYTYDHLKQLAVEAGYEGRGQ